MSIQKQTMYKCDDGQTYATYGEAQIAQKKFNASRAAAVAAKKQKDVLYKILGEMSSNSSANSCIVTDLITNKNRAIQLRDAMNRVVDYHRRRNTKH